MQELQLVVVMCDYFQMPGPESTRNSVFLSLFGGGLSKNRITVLIRLISTAISALIAPLLCAAGTWMQQVGCTAPPSLELAGHLIKDFVTFSPNVGDQLESLPMIAPRFAANLMTAVCDLYLTDAHGGTTLQPPPSPLLRIFSEWVFENPNLCLAASQQPLVLPVGAIAMPVLTPLAGMIRWCVLAPFSQNADQKSYSKLQFAILRTLQQQSPAPGPPSIINAQHLVAIINTLQMKLLEAAEVDPGHVQMSLERFSQAIQVAISSNCVYGNTLQLLTRLEELPSNEMLDIVIKANR